MDFLSYLVKTCWVSVQAYEGCLERQIPSFPPTELHSRAGEGAAHSQHLTLNVGSPAQQGGIWEPEVRTLKSIFWGGFLSASHSPSQMDQPLSRSSRTSAYESQHRWAQLRTEQCSAQNALCQRALQGASHKHPHAGTTNWKWNFHVFGRDWWDPSRQSPEGQFCLSTDLLSICLLLQQGLQPNLSNFSEEKIETLYPTLANLNQIQLLSKLLK